MHMALAAACLSVYISISANSRVLDSKGVLVLQQYQYAGLLAGEVRTMCLGTASAAIKDVCTVEPGCVK